MSTESDPLTIGLVAHHAFCPRRAWLEVHGESTDFAQMAQGVADHLPADDLEASRVTRRTAVDVHSEALNLVGRCDAVVFPLGGPVTVVEIQGLAAARLASADRPSAHPAGALSDLPARAGRPCPGGCGLVHDREAAGGGEPGRGPACTGTA